MERERSFPWQIDDPVKQQLGINLLKVESRKGRVQGGGERMVDGTESVPSLNILRPVYIHHHPSQDKETPIQCACALEGITTSKTHARCECK
jgi:hypothetical protein